MSTFIIDPEDAVSDFLRVHLTDPRSRAESSQTDTITATAGQTQITLTPPSGSVSAITSITVNAVAKSKWKDYHWDYQSKTITFYTALTLNDSVAVTYKYGSTNWIFSDRPDDQLSATNFPRISVFTVSDPGNRLGQYNAPVEHSVILQIDIWSKDKYVATIDSRNYHGNYLTRYLGYQITKAFEDNEDNLFPLLYGYRPVSGPRAAGFSEEYQAHHSIVEVNLKTLKVGRIEV